VSPSEVEESVSSAEDGGEVVEASEDGVTRVVTQLGDELFRFESFSKWVNKAQSWFRSAGFTRDQFVCIDAAGRICKCGNQFMRAEVEETYPITVYLIDNDQLPGGATKTRYKHQRGHDARVCVRE
jgi:hypothetical protein